MLRTIIVVVNVVSVMMACTAAAAPPRGRRAQRPDPRAVEARKACAAGNVDRGVELLAEIVVANGDPNAVYNQARCYQQNARPEQAVARFREYLRTAKTLSPDDRLQVQGYIAELEAEIEARTRRQAVAARPGLPPTTVPPAEGPAINKPPAAPAASPVAPPVAPPVATAAPAPMPVAATTLVTATAPSALAAPPPPPDAELATTAVTDQGRPLRTAAIAVAAIGAASIAGGAYFGWRTGQVARDVEAQRGPVDRANLEDMLARGKRNETLQWIGYGTGAAAIGAAAALYFLDRTTDGAGHAGGPRVGVQPLFVGAAAGAGVVAAGAF